jgi:ribosome-associated translation inhibitor RaiA
MQVQVNTDNNIQGSDELYQQVEDSVTAAVGRFSERITRVEVHLTDRNSDTKSGSNDKRCVMEARLTGLQPLTVSDDGETLDRALQGAAGKLRTVVTRTLERLNESKGRQSYSGE